MCRVFDLPPLFLLIAASLLIGPPAAAGDAAQQRWFDAGRDHVRAVAGETGAAPTRARNVILFVGDGMGVSTVTAARILEGQLRGEPGEENLLSFERFPHLALVKTYNTNQQTPDSAGTMTAMVTGVKTQSGVLAVDEGVVRRDHTTVAGRKLETLIEQAEDRGLATGIVTTASVTHATPAAGYAHSPERDWEDDSRLTPDAQQAGFPDIARQLLEFDRGDGIEVVLGGGRAHFLPTATRDPEDTEQPGRRLDGRHLAREWASRDASAFVWNQAQFDAVDPEVTRHLLGLFEPDHMQFEVDRAKDRAGEPSLAQMTAMALDILQVGEKGYVLVVEGGRIDHAHHAGNAYRALHDTIAFSAAVAEAAKRTSAQDTLILVTADHSHVFTIGGYPTRGNPILGKTIDNLGSEPADGPALAADGKPYTTLSYANGPGAADGARADLSEVDTTSPSFRQQAMVPLASETHAGEDVAVYARGPGAQWVRGVIEQNVLYHVMARALGFASASE